MIEGDKEYIIKQFKGGATIKGLTEFLYVPMKEREKNKAKDERVKINLNDVKNLVEQTIYENCFAKGEHQ